MLLSAAQTTLSESTHSSCSFLSENQTSSGESSESSRGESFSNSELSNTILNYVSKTLMEDEMESRTSMVQDFLALQATERSFYDLLGQKYPPSPRQPSLSIVKNVAEMPVNHVKLASNQVVKVGKDGRYLLSKKGDAKIYKFENSDNNEEIRSNKQFASYVEETDIGNMLDEVFGCGFSETLPCSLAEASKTGRKRMLEDSEQPRGHNGKRARKNQGEQEEFVDLWTLLSHCAQAVAINDNRTANEVLNQIRQHSSPCGDGMQRMAHYFANGLEARLAGRDIQLYMPYLHERISVANMLRAYKVYVQACPFTKVSNFFASRSIQKRAKKAKRIHIIDFGILYGFQWPCLINSFSKWPGGPPKLRITGIDLPRPGLQSTAGRVEETGHHLKNYCKRYNILFEYKGMAQRWDTICLEDLQIDRDDTIIVNCMYSLKHLRDETVVVPSPRDAVLDLIKRIKPDLFIHGVVNGTYNSPFFHRRFREALHHFSAIFDMFDESLSPKNQERMLFEKDIFAREAVNVIAYEGLSRLERPESYKQWQARNQRAGFKQLPLDREIMNTARTEGRLRYHNNFVVEEDGGWMLQGWKGRIIYALSCWRLV